MKNGFLIFFALLVLIILGAYYFLPSAQNTVDSFNSQQDGVLSQFLAEAPGFMEWLNDRFRLFAIFVVLIAIVISVALGKSETGGFLTFMVFGTLAVGIWFAGGSIGNWFNGSSISLPSDNMYALKLCIFAWTLPFFIIWGLFSRAQQSGGQEEGETV